MCGIVGYANIRPVAEDLIESLGRLEYRGYDSAGVCLAAPGFVIRKVAGRARDLNAALTASDHLSCVGIAHTRWATHGKPEARNAHPHAYNGVAVVHNGIIENHAALRATLAGAGHVFLSETDSEVVPHLIAQARAAGDTPVQALRHVTAQLHGAYALAVMFVDLPGIILVARKGSPVMVGCGDNIGAVASDPLAMAGICSRFAALEDGDIAEISARQVHIIDASGVPVRRPWCDTADDIGTTDIGHFEHHTRREIAEQPQALRRTLAALENIAVPAAIAASSRLVMIACGSSYYAAAIARPVIEKLTGIPCDLEIASEYRYRDPIIPPGSTIVLVSQSGETADTLAAMALVKSRAAPIIAVVNVAHSAMARGADLLWPTSAGREQGVAATKSFTAQLAALMRLGVAIAEANATCPHIRQDVMAGLNGAARAAFDAEQLEPAIAELARVIAYENEALFIGRGAYAALAGEAALKLKELSYIRADSYAAGELKHGPIALLRLDSPAIVFAPNDTLIAKTIVSAEEMRARGAHVMAITDMAGAQAFAGVADTIIALPGEGVAHIFAAAVAQQLLAYHAALALQCDVDHPRNLAKSVTVE